MVVGLWCTAVRPDNGRCPAVTVDVQVEPRDSRVNSYSIDIVPAVRLLEWPRPAQYWSSRWLPRFVTDMIRDPTTNDHLQPCVVPKIHDSGTTSCHVLYRTTHVPVHSAVYAVTSRNLARRRGPPCQISPHRCSDKGIGPPKLKFLLRFDQNVEYKRPAGAYPLRVFHKICRVCTPFQAALAVKISFDLLKELWSYRGFKLTGSGYPHIFSAPAAKLCVKPPKVVEVQERARGPLSARQVWWGSDLSLLSVCLSVCLSTLLNVRDCAPDFALKALEPGPILACIITQSVYY